MKVFAVIHYSDGLQAVFKTRGSATKYIKNTLKKIYHEDVEFDVYIGEGMLQD